MKTLYKIHLLFLVVLGHLSMAQPTMVMDINSGFSGSSPMQLYAHNGLLYFSADDSSGSNSGGNDLGRELWVSNGTQQGTMLLKDINQGTSNSIPSSFFTMSGNELYFTANAGTGTELFVTDGTESGTQVLGIVGTVESPVLLNGLIYYKNSNNKLFQFNGTTAQAVAGSGSEYIQGDQLVELNGLIFAYMNMSSEINTYGTELYSYNPNTDSFQIVADIGGGTFDSEVNSLVRYDNNLYFSTFSESEIWKSDGTSQGTEVVISEDSSFSGLKSFAVWDSKLFFEGDNGTGDQLWMYNQASDNTINLSVLDGNANHDPSDFVPLDGWLYYSAKDSNDNNMHLWRTNGIEIVQLDNTINGIDEITVVNGKLYFEGNNGTNGNELFVFDPASLSIEMFSTQSIVIYPNPATHTINIQTSNTLKSANLYSVLGKKIAEASQGIIDVSNFESGIYLVKIETENGVCTKKIIIN